MSSASADASASYAAEVARLLWPTPWEEPFVTRGRHNPGQPHRDAYLFPSGRRPRLLVPVDLPASSSMLQRLGNGRTTMVDPVRALLERSVRSRAFGMARWPVLRVLTQDPDADSIERYLARVFGTEVRVGVLLGTRRVNQKPVLQVFDHTGGLLGYAKIGHNELTAGLVRREAAALTAVREQAPRSFRLPSVLHLGIWAGLEVMVLSPLSTSPRQAVSGSTRLTAMREVAYLTGTTAGPLATGAFWARIRGSAERRCGADGHRLRTMVRTIEEDHGTAVVHQGGWHGDWGRWNMGMCDGVLQLWDWERYDPAVPIGFDALHFAAQSVRPGERDAHRQEVTFLGSTPSILAELGVPDGQHELVLRLYLLEMATRYVDALAHGVTPALRRRTSWVLSLLERLAEHPHHVSPEGSP